MPRPATGLRWVTAFQHFVEHPIGVVTALVGALGALVIDPCEHDHLAQCVVTEEKPVLLKKLGSEPVLVIVTEGLALGLALPVFRQNISRY